MTSDLSLSKTGTVNWKGKHAGRGRPPSGFLKLCTALGMLPGPGPPGLFWATLWVKFDSCLVEGGDMFLENFLCFVFSTHTHSLQSGSKDQIVCTMVTAVISARRDPLGAKVVAAFHRGERI